MSDFASSVLYDFAIQQLRARGYHVDVEAPYQGRTDALSKRDLLDATMSKLGPGAILSIGQAVREVEYEPTLAVLRRAVDAADLIERWRRLEAYHHGNHRVRLVEAGETYVDLQHYALTSKPPSKPEDLLIAGLLAGLLENIGCKNLSLSIADVAVLTPAGLNTSGLSEHMAFADWRYEWSGYKARTDNTVVPPDSTTLGETVLQLIADDPGRGWQIDMVAKALHLSKRSLQRRLSSEAHTFQKLLRRARTDAAASAIIEKSLSYAQIGYACGFSDQAHFSREFKLRFNMPPQSYANLAEGI